MSDMNDVMDHPIPGALIPGWMQVPELEWLYERAQEMTSIVEIGSWKGRSTSALCAGCQGTVYAVDPWLGFGEQMMDEPWTIFQETMKPYSNCVPIRSLSKYAVNHPKMPASVDMVFIDGEHEYQDVMTDLNTWYPKVTKLICGHDRPHPGVLRAIVEFCSTQHLNLMVGPISIWYAEIHR